MLFKQLNKEKKLTVARNECTVRMYAFKTHSLQRLPKQQTLLSFSLLLPTPTRSFRTKLYSTF